MKDLAAAVLVSALIMAAVVAWTLRPTERAHTESEAAAWEACREDALRSVRTPRTVEFGAPIFVGGIEDDAPVGATGSVHFDMDYQNVFGALVTDGVVCRVVLGEAGWAGAVTGAFR